MPATLVNQIAESILYGFNRHFSRFQRITKKAKLRFEAADWEAEDRARKDRIYFYDKRVSETVDYIRDRFDLESADKTLWQDIKRQYLWLLYGHGQPELAESFYNSVFCRLFDRSYFNNRHIFVKPGAAVELLDLDDPVYRSWYPDETGLRRCLDGILNSFDLSNPWENLERDLNLVEKNLAPCLTSTVRPEPFTQFQVVSSLFFRNKAAYIVGRVLVGHHSAPFVVPLLLTERRELYVDTVIINADDIALIFSFTRAYFMVDTKAPAGLVHFLEKILPSSTRADIYTSIGFQKQGKTLFYREFLHHLEHSTDRFVIAPGIRGMVMTVFTLPSYPYVFKVINDEFPPPKNIDRKTVKKKYQMVKTHDRVGRMADTLEFSHVAFPLDRFSDELLHELQSNVPSSLFLEKDCIIIGHLYIERRMIPFNIFLETTQDEELLERSIRSYGNAIKEMIAANIFPGDMLLKNFGVTRHGRVVFYDYDEISAMTDIRIRAIPKARSEEEEFLQETWFHVEEHDFFPEQFDHFVASHARIRKKFLSNHPELLQPDYWKGIQQDIQNNRRHDVFPYRQEKRFVFRYPGQYHDRGSPTSQKVSSP